MNRFCVLSLLVLLIGVTGCGSQISKDEYDAKNGSGAWDRMEEQESRDNAKRNSYE